MEELHSITTDRIRHLIERALYHGSLGDEGLKEMLLAEAKIQAMVMNGADNMIYMTYHRYFSETSGVSFERTHGDPDLMFGGV